MIDLPEYVQLTAYSLSLTYSTHTTHTHNQMHKQTYAQAPFQPIQFNHLRVFSLIITTVHITSLLLLCPGAAMIKAAEYGHNSWELSVVVDQQDLEESMRFKMRVEGTLHIGGLMLKLVEKISE